MWVHPEQKNCCFNKNSSKLIAVLINFVNFLHSTMAESRQVNLAKANLARAHGAKRVRIDLESEVDQLKALKL